MTMMIDTLAFVVIGVLLLTTATVALGAFLYGFFLSDDEENQNDE